MTKAISTEERKILSAIDKAIPLLSDEAKTYLLGFGAGLEKALSMKEQAKQPEEKAG